MKDKNYRINYGNGQVSEDMTLDDVKRELDREPAGSVSFIQKLEWAEHEESFRIEWRRARSIGRTA